MKDTFGGKAWLLKSLSQCFIRFCTVEVVEFSDYIESPCSGCAISFFFLSLERRKGFVWALLWHESLVAPQHVRS